MVASLVLSCVSYGQDNSTKLKPSHWLLHACACHIQQAFGLVFIFPCFWLAQVPTTEPFRRSPLSLFQHQCKSPWFVTVHRTDKRDGEHPLVSHCALHWQERWRAVVNDECDFHFKIVPTSISSLVLMSLDYFQHSHCRRCHPWNQHWNL